VNVDGISRSDRSRNSIAARTDSGDVTVRAREHGARHGAQSVSRAGFGPRRSISRAASTGPKPKRS
jgi:hypothetical protein